MIVYTVVVITTAIFFLACLVLWRTRGISPGDCWPQLLLSVSLAGFIHFYGVWVFLSVYCKYIADVCFGILLLVVLLRKKTTGVTRRYSAAVSLLFTSLLSILILLYFTGTAGKPYGTLDIAPPFRAGTYFVFQGGAGLPTNIFHYSGRRTVYAMDIIKLNSAGNRAKQIFSHRLDDYEIFGDTICAPCNGTVKAIESSNPDNIPPLRKRGSKNLNYVLIETDSAYIFLGHLKQGCVFVQPGQQVTTGQPLGLAGNSGMSLEPHLHIQAHAKTAADIPWYRQPQLKIQFNGRSYLLFEEIHVH